MVSSYLGILYNYTGIGNKLLIKTNLSSAKELVLGITISAATTTHVENYRVFGLGILRAEVILDNHIELAFSVTTDKVSRVL